MSYNLSILTQAQKQLADLPKGDYEKSRDAIFELAYNPRPPGCLKLKGREGWRIRVGNYRIIYEIDDTQKTVLVLHIGHRRDVYR